MMTIASFRRWERVISWEMVQWANCLLYKHEDSSLDTYKKDKLSMIIHVCNFSASVVRLEMETGEFSDVQKTLSKIRQVWKLEAVLCLPHITLMNMHTCVYVYMSYTQQKIAIPNLAFLIHLLCHIIIYLIRVACPKIGGGLTEKGKWVFWRNLSSYFVCECYYYYQFNFLNFNVIT